MHTAGMKGWVSSPLFSLAFQTVLGRRCLQEHMEEDAMSSECKEEVQSDQIRSNQDYRSAPVF